MPVSEWGVPDWRDASAYPDPATFSESRWRWEFTRRRKDYREAWDTWAPITHARQATYAKGKLLSADDLNFRAEVPKAKELFGLYGSCPNPRNPEPRVGGGQGPILLNFNNQVWLSGAHDLDRLREAHLRLNPGEVVLKFRLDAPIEEQIAKAKQTLLE